MNQLPYFGSVDYVAPDGEVWQASCESASGSSSGQPGPVQTCLLKFSRKGEVRVLHHAPLTWKNPAVLAELFARAGRDDDEE